MDADPATLTEPERRVALLDWLARGRDIRIAAELCGEKHDWAKDIAKEAGHPDRDQIRQALAAAKAELHPPRQPLKPDTLAPARADAPVVDHVPCGDPEHCAAGGECIDYADELPDEQADALAAAEHLADVVDHAIETGEPLLDDPATCQHTPHLVLQGRVWHAVCPACGTTWHRTRCTAPGCGAYVSAEYIARTGSTRHDWHPKEQS